MSLRTSNNSQKIKKYNKLEQQEKKYDISLLDIFVWKEEKVWLYNQTCLSMKISIFLKINKEFYLKVTNILSSFLWYLEPLIKGRNQREMNQN